MTIAALDRRLERLVESLRPVPARDDVDRLSSYCPYPKQIEFHSAGATARQRLLTAANQVGKTLCAAAECAMHSTGRYPDWWQGWRSETPTVGLVCGLSWTLLRDVIQKMLFGVSDSHQRDEIGTGMIPRADILMNAILPGPVSGSISQARVHHQSGGISTIHAVPYLAGRQAVQSFTADWAWCDEEPPSSFYTELLTRTNYRLGPVFVTFTPLLGMSDVVRRFFEPSPEDTDSRALVTMTLEDALHYTPEQRSAIESAYPVHERDARCRGIPKLGVGAVYPLSRDEISCQPFPIPEHWPRAYGMDVGWNRTAAIFGALDQSSDTVYLYHSYYAGNAVPVVHAAAINAPGRNIPGVIDPASRGRSQLDGKALIDEYAALGLDITPADNTVETGIYCVWDRLSTGRMKVFSHLSDWFSEQQTYHRDENGKIVKEHDHLLDATRYLLMSGLQRMRMSSAHNNQEKVRTAWKV